MWEARRRIKPRQAVQFSGLWDGMEDDEEPILGSSLNCGVPTLIWRLVLGLRQNHSREAQNPKP